MTAVALRSRVVIFVVSLFVLAGSRQVWAQVPVTTWHYDNLHSGANLSETILTPANVNANSFGKLFTQPVDGAVIGQALYLPSVTIPGAGVHNVVYVVTMNDSVYAFDADSATGSNASPLWHTSFLINGATPIPISLQGCGPTTAWTHVGIVSTPVINPVSGTLFVVSKTLESSKYVHRLHALDVTTGLEKTGSPIVITASYQTGGKTYVFKDKMQVNRPGLLLEHGILYIAFGSNGCRGGQEEGWVVAYNETTLEQQGAFDVEPGQSAAAIWQRGGSLSADSSGYIYGATADGPFLPGVDFGQSVIKLAQVGDNLQLSDWFTPYNEKQLDLNDLDMSEPVLVLPNQSGTYPHLAAAVGKQGTIYLLNRDNMGHFCSTCTTGDSQIVQELIKFAPMTGALIFWNNTIYTTADGSPIYALALNQGQLATTPLAKSKVVASGHSPIISSNGTSNGILWQIDGPGLHAFDATSLERIYANAQAPHGRDLLPPLPHFANLMVVNGKLYIGTNNSLVVYGLLN
jgi:PQQ-like domain